MELKHGWFPQREPKPLEYPTCAGCKQPIVRTLPVRERGLVAHDPRCLKRAVRIQEQDTPINLATGRAVVTEVMREGGLAVYGYRWPVSVASLGGLEVG
jgi:hypothetical protein